MAIPLKVLIVEDSPSDAALDVRALEKAGYKVTHEIVATAKEMKAALKKHAFDLIIADHNLPQFDSLKALALLKESGQDIPFIVVSGTIGEETAVKIMKAGAHDYVMKGNLSRLGAAVERELREVEVRRERKQVEEELQKNMEQLERSNAELQSFAYVASHDLQEPLRTIYSYMQLLERRYKSKLDGEAKEFIDFALIGVKRLQNMISGLLEYSRVETQGDLFEMVSCESVIEHVARDLKKAIEDSKAEITHGPLPKVFADRVQLTRLIQNLVANSIKYHGSEPLRIDVSAAKQDREYVFAVSDNGIGIAPEYTEQIFVIFQRLHGRDVPGIGLGLSVAKKIVERHGGRIWVESEPGKGATFYFTIPIKGGNR